MNTLALILKLLHVFAAIWLMIGIIGRTVLLSRAEHSQEIESVRVLLPVAHIFESKMVIPGSSAVLLAGLVTAWVQGWPILGFLQGGASNWVLVSLLLFATIFRLSGLSSSHAARYSSAPFKMLSPKIGSPQN
jgi:hypothetical protein